MEDIQQRKYYRIFTGTNQTAGNDKIYLGYEARTSETIFKKGRTTFFHSPFFSQVQNISATSLGNDGAMSGPIPALADRIFKKRGNYENTTPWGPTTGKADGTWLCTWYYAASTETPMWLDRYYNPGRLTYEEALEGTASFTDYVKNDPIYYDVPSTLLLEPGAYYAFYHHDENEISKIVETFAGESKDRLRLNIDNWAVEDLSRLDKSIYNNNVTLENFTNNWILSTSDPGYTDRYILSFDNSDFINCFVNNNSSYNLENEITISFWVNHKNWSNATSTQLIGNLQKGGYGIFYNNLNYNPFFVVPENYYGHLFYFNQETETYTEKNVQLTLTEPVNIVSVAINSNSEIINVDATNLQILKYNHLGDVLAISKNSEGENVFYEGTFIQLLIDADDNVIIYTTTKVYTFDRNLVLTNTTNTVNNSTSQFAYNFDNVIVRQLSSLDLKFDSYNNKWHIGLDKKLYKNDLPVTSLQSYNCTLMAIDPDNVLWVLAETNKVIKINTLTNNIVSVFEVGVDSNLQDSKNISFIQIYNKPTNTFVWRAVVYYDLDKTLYYLSLDGRTIKTVYLPQKLNIIDPVTALQDINLLKFSTQGDFTGYEYRRIFNKIKYNYKPQIQFKVSVQQGNRNLPNSVYTLSVPVDFFANDTWHLITVTIKNAEVRMYIDNALRDVLVLPNNTTIDYDYKNDLYIGSPSGKFSNLNKEINSKSVIWNGYIDSIKMYDYAIDPRFIKFLVLEKNIFSDIIWNIPTTAIQYVEGIERVFKHRMPGHKSAFFNLKLTGSSIKDLETRAKIERDLRLAVESTKPGYSELLNIEWSE